MSHPNATLTSLWVDDGSGSPMKGIQTTPSKSTNNGTELKQDIVKIYKESGLEKMAKEAGILNENGDLTSPTVQPKAASVPISMITVPVQYSASTSMPGSPMILGTPQRIVNATQVMTAASPGTPHHLLATPLSVESPQSWSRKRPHELCDIEYSDGKRGKKGEKGGKGLRHFSMKVCEKVQKKGTTSYNEVADELVAEFTDPRSMTSADSAYDQKNIRRRVYDALNVLMAMNIISKEKKEIKWIGLPTNSAQECQNLLLEKQRREERIRVKTQQLQELILQQIAFKNLVQRNRQREATQGPPQPNSAIHLPFIIVNTSKQTVIDCSISNDKYEYLFNFNNTFEIHDDIEVLKRMGMAFGLERGQCNEVDLRRSIDMVPKSLQPYVVELAQQNPAHGSAGGVSLNISSQSSRPGQSPLAMPLAATSYDSMDAEVALATSQDYSRQSSVGSFSDVRGTPSEPFSESESERSSPVDMS